MPHKLKVAQHTPGPWIPHEQGEANEWCLLTNADRWVISFRQNGELMPPEQRANARLIAQAWLIPEMVKALRAWAKYDDSDMSGADCMFNYAEAIEATLALLARIDGETVA